MRYCWIFLLFTACAEWEPAAPADHDVLDGAIDGLTPAQTSQFLRGDAAFNNELFTTATGLGPLFVATSCGSCHPGDGKGHPFTALTRFGQQDDRGNQFIDAGGPQLQHRAIPGFIPEQVPAGIPAAVFIAPANTGLGLLDAVPDATLLAWADPDDANGDGISGRPNWVTLRAYTMPRAGSVVNNGTYIGRFGKKASAYDLLQQTANAYNQDIGIVSTFEPVDTYTHLPTDPEITDQRIHDVVFYLKTLKAPVPRPATVAILTGKNIFTTTGCAACHRPEMTTGDSPIAALAFRTIFPYSDLLLHDMGPGLDDGYTEGSATTAEWRTPPLWGLGLSADSQGGRLFLLHDGRARSIDEAIRLHGGEAAGSKDRYEALSVEEKKQLIQFLESL